MPSEVLNVGRLMREATRKCVENNGGVRVSKDAVQEMIAFLRDELEGSLVPNAVDFCLKAGRKTVSEEDVIRAKDLL